MNKAYTIFTSIPKLLKLVVFITLSATLISSCGSKDVAKPEQQSALNVINAINAGPTVNFYLNDRKVGGSILKENDDTGYFITLPGTREFGVAYDGTLDFLFKSDITLNVNTYHSAFIIGESSSATVLITQDDLSVPAAGKAKIRFVHLTSDGGAFTLAIKNGATLFSSKDFRSVSDFISIDAGTYDLQLKNANGTVLKEVNATLGSGKIYNIWSSGLQSGVGNSPIGLQVKFVN